MVLILLMILGNIVLPLLSLPPFLLPPCSFSCLQQLVCHSQHTYFYSQAMVHALGEKNREHSHFIHWLSEEIQKEARKRSYIVN